MDNQLGILYNAKDSSSLSQEGKVINQSTISLSTLEERIENSEAD